MRSRTRWILGVACLTLSFFQSAVFAGGLESAKAGTPANALAAGTPANALAAGTSTAARKVNDAVTRALQPGTFPFAQEMVEITGTGLDWYFDRLTVASDKARVSRITDDVVGGIGKGFQDVKFESGLDRALDSAESLFDKLWINDFDSQILKGTPVQVHPYFKSQVEYQSNTFQEPRNSDHEDLLFTYTPGFYANVPFGDELQYSIGTVYEARILDYHKYDDHEDIGQSVGAKGEFKFTDWLYAGVTEEFVKDSSRAGSLYTKRVEYVDQKLSPTAGLNWRDWTLEGSYLNAHRRFPSRIYDSFEYDNNMITAKLLRTIAPDFRGLVEYNYSHYDYDFDVTRPGRYHQVRGGFTGKLSERSVVNARIGYMDRSYSRDDLTEFDKLVGDLRLKHQLTKRTGFDFYFHRTSHESSFTNNRFVDEKLFQGSWNHLLTAKFRARTGIALSRRDFDATAAVGRVVVKRRDLGAGLFAGLDYVFRPWLMMNCDYRYERANSNVSDFDFTNNIVSVGMTMPM